MLAVRQVRCAGGCLGRLVVPEGTWWWGEALSRTGRHLCAAGFGSSVAQVVGLGMT